MTSTASSAGRLARASAFMASGSLVSRALGFVRNYLLGAVVAGTGSAVSNSVSAANNLPNTVWILIGGGVLNAILVPAIVRATKRPDRGSDYVSRLMTLVVLCSAILTALCILLVPVLVQVVNGRMEGSTLSLAVTLGYWMMPQIMFSALYVMAGQLLNAHESFGPYQWAPVMNNVVGIVGSVVFLGIWGSRPPGSPWWTLPTGIADPSAWTMPMVIAFALYNVGGSAAQVIFLWFYVRKLGLRLRPAWGFRGLGLGSLSRLGLWTLAMLGVAQVGIAATRWSTETARDMAAHFTAAGDMTRAAQYPALYALDSSYLAFMIPQGIIAVSVVTAAFPSIARSASDDDHDEVLRRYARTSRLLAVPMVLATAIFIALAAPIMWVIVGKTGPIAAGANGWVLAGYMVGLLPYSATYLVKRVFYAYEDARTSFLVQLPISLVPVLAVWPILTYVDPLWATAVAALASSMGNILGWILSLWMLDRRVRRSGASIQTAGTTLSVMLRLFAAGAAALAVGSGMTLLLDGPMWTSRVMAVVLGAVIAAVMTAVFGALGWVLGVPEVRGMVGAVAARLPGRRA